MPVIGIIIMLRKKKFLEKPGCATSRPSGFWNKGKILLAVALFAAAVSLTMSGSGAGRAEAASGMTDIRVGLAALYSAKNEIRIANTEIGLGYCIKDSYQCDAEFASSTGFTFSPAQGYYYILGKTFASYGGAEQAAAVIRRLGVDAWPVSIYRNYWRVYVGGQADRGSAESMYAGIEGRFGYTYSALSGDNGHRLLVQADGYAFLIDGGKKAAYPQFRALRGNPSGNYVLDLGNRSYRGRIEIGRYGKGSVTAVNIIHIESYLYGVVPCEMQASYETEALKAQAVCARSYALTKVGYHADSNINRAYYLDDTTKSQVYRGYFAENARTTAAVDATAGIVVRKNGVMVPAYFFSTSGGSTEDVGEVWGLASSYLKAVPDLYETEPERGPWLAAYTRGQIASKLDAYDLGVGAVDAVIPQVTTMTGRVYTLKIRGSDGSTSLQAGSIREVLSLYSTKFKVVEKGDIPDLVVMQGAERANQARISGCYVISAGGLVEKAPAGLEQYIVIGAANLVNYPKNAPVNGDTYYFYGMGYGHGVGMSQSGANGMAAAGFTYKDIIEYYYTGCTCY